MSVRRGTTNRLTLFRNCGICGKPIVTTADTPWVRQMARDGKRQATTYFCSTECYQASYKHIGWYDGKAAERRKQKEFNRNRHEYNVRYYAENRDRERARSKQAWHFMSGEERVKLAEYRRKLYAIDRDEINRKRRERYAAKRDAEV